MGGNHRSRLVQHREAVLELVAQQPDLTLQEIRGALAAGNGIAGFVTATSGGLKGGKGLIRLTPLQRRLTIAPPLRL
jgi:hypothetical protein